VSAAISTAKGASQFRCGIMELQLEQSAS
jgi:hypothetical protein